MTNKERQKSLDKKKWIESERYNLDFSGVMPYCEHCKHSTLGGNCTATQEERERKCLCATAYNRMQRKSR